MFLTLKQNFTKNLSRFTKSTSHLLKINFNNFKFAEKVNFEKLDNSAEMIDKYFTEQEQYIANFYKKHKDNFLHQENHDREFEEFLIQMESLIEKDLKRKRMTKKYVTDMGKISIQSRESLKEVMIYYQLYLTKNGFDSEVLAETLQFLGDLYQSRENFHRIYSDFTHWDFINSYRTYHIIEDLKFGLVNDNSFMSTNQIAKSIRGLTLCGYKNTQVADLIFERLLCFLTKQKMNKTYEKFVDAPGMGKFKYNATNLNAEDLFYDEKFRKHLFKLNQIKFNENNENENLKNVENLNINDKNIKKVDYDQELLYPIREIIELLKETKEIQHGLTDSIDNLLDQYYKIEQALLENSELKDNPYIKYELFKLQDKLVEGGYLTIDALNEVTKNKLSEENLEKLKHENIVQVMRDFTLLNFPNLYNQGEKQLDLLLEESEKLENFKLNSSRFNMTDVSLGECLAALSDYAKLTNVDINGEDYINDKITKEFVNSNFMKENKEQIKIKAQYTLLFNKTENFLKKIEPLLYNIVKETNDLAALGYIYYAYSNLNISSTKELKNQIINKILNLSENENNLTSEEIKYTIIGLVKGEIRNENVLKIVRRLCEKIKVDKISKIDEMVKLLWGLSAMNLHSSPAYINLLIRLSENAENLVNYITEQTEFNMELYQLSVSLKYEAKDLITIPHNLNTLLDLHLNMREFSFTKIQYGKENKEINQIPNEMLIDPIKSVIFNGMQEGIFSKQIQREFNMALTQLETQDSHGHLPFFPDLVTGFYGNKVAIYILGKDYITDDSSVNGYCHIIKRILKEKFNTHAVFIPTGQLIQFDLRKVHMNILYTDEGFTNHLENIIAQHLNINLEDNKVFQVNKYLNLFIKKFSQSNQGEIVFQTENSNNLENFMNSLLKIIDLHSELVNSYHKNLIEKKVNELRLNLAKNKSHFNEMSETFKLFVNDLIVEITLAKIDYEIFLESFSKSYESILIHHIKNNKNLNDDFVINSDWLGKRLNVDLINININKENILKEKNISVELLNNNFMWSGDYNPYQDWEEEFKSDFDNFNYFVENSNSKYLYNSHKFGNRKVPNGIFPHPNKFRHIKSPIVRKQIEASSNYEYELKSYKNYNQKLVNDEVDKNRVLSLIEREDEVSLKVNLLNIKNSLKQNMNDNQIIKFITNFEFIDQLIDEHLNLENNKNTNESNNKFLKRDPEAFINYYKKLNESCPQYDEYDKFIMREYYNEKKILEFDPKITAQENMKRMEDKMSKKIELNEDNDAISIWSPNNIDYKYNIDSVITSQRLSEIDNDVDEYSSDLFLTRKRLLAERNIILLRIIVKLSNSSSTLNEKEQNYLTNLLHKLNETNINKIQDLGLNNNVTQLKFENLSANDIYACNSLYNVELNEKSNQFNLNELILEISQFIDNSTINKLISDLYEKLVMKNDSVSVNNKEPTLISNEIKETLWRVSGFINQEDKTKLKNLLRVKRGKTKFDKIWLRIDEKSFEDFVNTANIHEDRLGHLEKWIKRKEKEIENRIDMPPENLAISDTKINKLIDRKDKAFRKTILFEIFKVDNINKIDNRNANQFINEFCMSLYQFNFKYPQSILDIFNALEDVPSLYEEDRQLLKNFKMFFEVEEKNPFEFLSVTPVALVSEKLNLGENNSVEKIEDFLNEKLMNRIKSSSIPFIPNLVERILQNIKTK